MFELFMGGNPNGSLPVGQKLFTVASTDWTVPDGVTDISAVCVGSGGGNTSNRFGGSGGDLRWRNHISVTPGEVLTITVGIAAAGKVGVSTKIVRKSNGQVLLLAKGGDATDTSTAMDGSTIGGGNGGAGSGTTGGGAGGYAGNGGTGIGKPADTGSGGGGTGSGYSFNGNGFGTGGGGVGVLGKGADGLAGPNNTGSQAIGGGGGSGGVRGDHTTGGNYGGGCGAPASITSASLGGNGACRLIWGSGRAFPATKTADIIT